MPVGTVAMMTLSSRTQVEVIPQTLGRQEGRGEEVLGMMGSISPFMAPPSPGGGKLFGQMVGDGFEGMVAQKDGPVWDPPEQEGQQDPEYP